MHQKNGLQHSGDGGFRQLVDAAWFEFRVTKTAGGSGSETMLGAGRAPGGFVGVELGFAACEGPSLQMTLLAQVDQRRGRRRAMSLLLGAAPAVAQRARPTSKRTSPAARAALLDGLVERGLAFRAA